MTSVLGHGFTKRTIARVAAVAFALAPLAVAAPPASAQSLLASRDEAKCAKKLGIGAIKLSRTAAKVIAKCRDAELAGNHVGSCPDAKAQAKIDAKLESLIRNAAKKCGSVCAVSSDIACVGDDLCPPLGRAVPPAPESCSAGAKNRPFDMRSLGFPGPFCEALLGHPIVDAEDLGACVGTIALGATHNLVDSVYGSVAFASSPSDDARKCLKRASKEAQKLATTIVKGIVRCRDRINKGKVSGNPSTCRFDDSRLSAKIAKRIEKLETALAKSCSGAAIFELDLCGNGVGGISTAGEAADCIVDAALEIADAQVSPADRRYGRISIVEASYPPEATCGDGVVNQVPSPFLLLGEECDGDDDAACPGRCAPAGDVFECTCTDVPRTRFFADGLRADLDNGWTGTSHDSGVADGAGYVYRMTNCDCDSFAGATCTGSTSDPVCDITGTQLPVCSWDTSRGSRCDAHGDGNGRDENRDCFVCDQFSANAGSFCENEGDCEARCFAGDGTAVGPCIDQTDCATGTVCRGQCDRDPVCIITPNGAPLPISSGGTAVCILTTFRDDVVGTQNVVTGEHEHFLRQFSRVHLGVTSSVPCPVCGGFCDGGGFLDGEVCTGRCGIDGSSCRFDSDCPANDFCSTSSPDCPNGFCNLSLVCRGGARSGQACRVEAATAGFGTTSSDCPPLPSQNISGQGLEINFLPQTSENVALPASVPCTSPGFSLYDCPCPDDGGLRTRPNACAAACDAGMELGQGCATGGGAVGGRFTTCAGGVHDATPCDEDSDCPGGSCSANPKHCVGGAPADERRACTSNADCGLGTCVDACPTGRCVPLCNPSVSDAEEGVCAAGPPVYHCSGEDDEFRICTATEANGGCAAVCATSCGNGVPAGGSGLPCTDDSGCGAGETCCGSCALAKTCEAGIDGLLGTTDDFPGAGICIADSRRCFTGTIAAEGGDIFNGRGDPTEVRSVAAFCIGKTANSAINAVAGLGGPGRLRQEGVNLTNGFSSLP